MGPPPTDERFTIVGAVKMDFDHLYRETAHWVETVTLWEGLGFTFDATWGTAPHRGGRLTAGDTAIVIAEVSPGESTTDSVFIAVDDLERVADLLGAPITDTHWGTRMVTMADPDGRTYNFEPGGTR